MKKQDFADNLPAVCKSLANILLLTGLLLCACMPVYATAQTLSDIEFASGIPDAQDEHRVILAAGDSSSTTLKTAVSLPYYLYKLFVSSQDARACSFHPSCANYTMLAVRKFGLPAGLVMGFDRLTRCHNRDWDHYEVHPETLKWKDEP